MRKIQVNGREYKWMCGRCNVKIACAEESFTKIIPYENIGHHKWVCSECQESSDNREDVCSFAEYVWVVTPKDIRAAILAS